MIRATMVHFREMNYCARGGRAFFARYGWSWPDFLVNGIDCAILEASGDALAIGLAEYARSHQ